MKRILFFILKLAITLASMVAVVLGSLIGYATFTNYEPAEREDLNAEGSKGVEKIENDTVSFLIWNVGYTGLGKESDFFYDNGKMVISPKEWVTKNLQGIINELSVRQKNIDFFMLQEVDKDSKRGYFTNQIETIANALPSFNYTFGINYNVQYIAYPFHNPLGKVLGGLVTYSRYAPTQNTRYQLPGKFAFPKRVFYLDRCLLVQRYKTLYNKDLVVINLHNEAYDDGSQKAQQMEYLKKIMTTEYEKGNYVVAGGDWNQTPPNFNNLTFLKPNMEASEQIPVPANFMPQEWNWAFDPKVPTNRKNDFPFNKETTFTTVIDFYLTSPNLEIIETQGISNDFDFSDHQPVFLKIKLKP